MNPESVNHWKLGGIKQSFYFAVLGMFFFGGSVHFYGGSAKHEVFCYHTKSLRDVYQPALA